MLAPAIEALQASGLGGWARGPAYAWLNVAHLAGLVLLVGSIGLLDLRLLGAGRDLPLEAVWKTLTPLGIAGFAVSVASGAGLFAADAVALSGSRTFGWKLALLTLGCANAVVLRARWRPVPGAVDSPATVRVMAALSLALWLAVATLGRMIAYS